MATFDDILALAAPPEDVVPLCLAGNLVGQLRHLQRQLEDAPAVPASLAERSPAAALVEQIDAVHQQMRAATHDFRLRAMSPRDWAPFFARRPMPVDGEDEDQANARWFGWLAELVSRTCVDPVMDVEQVGHLVDRLHAESWQRLSDTAWALNSGRVSVPFSAAASDTTPASGPRSRRPPISPSPSANGAAPKSSKPRRTSTPKTDA